MVKENTNINKKLKEKQSLIVALEEQMKEVSEDDNENSVIEEVVTMENNLSGNKCNLCNSKFSINEELERHMQDKHTESDCPFCNETLSSKSKLRGHVNKCSQNGTTKVKCNKCQEAFSQFEIKRHIQQCQKKKVEEFNCEECVMLANTATKIKKHMKQEHENWIEKSQDICYHYKNGLCFRGDSCRYAHVGHQKKKKSDSTSSPSTDRDWTPACNKGDGCAWLARGACKFFHRGVGVQRPEHTQQRTNQTNSYRSRGINQGSGNSRLVFPPLRRGNQQQRRNNHGF